MPSLPRASLPLPSPPQAGGGHDAGEKLHLLEACLFVLEETPWATDRAVAQAIQISNFRMNHCIQAIEPILGRRSPFGIFYCRVLASAGRAGMEVSAGSLFFFLLLLLLLPCCTSDGYILASRWTRYAAGLDVKYPTSCTKYRTVRVTVTVCGMHMYGACV